jgi:hypothetical protein
MVESIEREEEKLKEIGESGSSISCLLQERTGNCLARLNCPYSHKSTPLNSSAKAFISKRASKPLSQEGSTEPGEKRVDSEKGEEIEAIGEGKEREEAHYPPPGHVGGEGGESNPPFGREYDPNQYQYYNPDSYAQDQEYFYQYALQQDLDEEFNQMENEVESPEFLSQFQNCTCCKGYVYNCTGDACQYLGSCYCRVQNEIEQT